MSTFISAPNFFINDLKSQCIADAASPLESGYASVSRMSRHHSERASKVASRAASPPPVHCKNKGQPNEASESTFTVSLDSGVKLELSQAQAHMFLSSMWDEEAKVSTKWLDELSWSSYDAYQVIQDKLATLEETIARQCGVHALNDMMNTNSNENDDNHVMADMLINMVDRVWNMGEDFDDNVNEFSTIDQKMDGSMSDSQSSSDSTCVNEEINIPDIMSSMEQMGIASNAYVNEDNPSGIPMQVHRRSSKPQREDAVFNIRYKTQTCLHYDRTGNCPAGDNCHFAHGPVELRKPKHHPKFRTEPCKHFVESGKCIYGKKCFFLHADRPLTLRARRKMEKSLRQSSKVRSITNKYATQNAE